MLKLAHRAWRLLPDATRRATMTHVATMIAIPPGAPPARSDGVIVAGDLDGQNGIAASGRMFAQALAARGLLRGRMPLGLPSVAPDFFGEPAPGAAILSVLNAPFLPVGLARLRPRDLLRGRRMIGVWVWELDQVPPEWAVGARYVHEVWAPSRFVADALEAVAPGRVRHVPYPLLTQYPFSPAGDRAHFGLTNDHFVVLTVFNLTSSSERKNPLGAITAFRRAFAARNDALLVIKLTGQDACPEDFARIRNAVGTATNIRLMTETLDEPHLHGLMQASDVLLSLHRSEGFGLIPATAALLGVPVVATGYSGNVDFMSPESSALIGYRLVPARDAHGVYTLPGARWAEPDLDEAAHWLERLADDTGLRATLGRAGQAHVLSALSDERLDAALTANGIA